MNQGVEILLSRMDSNPEEFVDGSKWDWIMRDVRKRVLKDRIDVEDGIARIPFLSDEEVKALYDKLESLRAEQFTRRVMATLLREEELVGGNEASSFYKKNGIYTKRELAASVAASMDKLLLDEWAKAGKKVKK